MLRKIKEKNVPGGRTILFPNWVDANFIRPLPKEQSLRKEFGIPDEDKVILYAGNLGEKQGLNIIIDVAGGFLDRKDVHFLIVGSGGNKQMLERQAAEKNLNNIKFFPLADYEKLPALLFRISSPVSGGRKSSNLRDFLEHHRSIPSNLELLWFLLLRYKGIL